MAEASATASSHGLSGCAADSPASTSLSASHRATDTRPPRALVLHLHRACPPISPRPAIAAQHAIAAGFGVRRFHPRA